jgi:hypothetical protein
MGHVSTSSSILQTILTIQQALASPNRAARPPTHGTHFPYDLSRLQLVRSQRFHLWLHRGINSECAEDSVEQYECGEGSE